MKNNQNVICALVFIIIMITNTYIHNEYNKSIYLLAESNYKQSQTINHKHNIINTIQLESNKKNKTVNIIKKKKEYDRKYKVGDTFYVDNITGYYNCEPGQDSYYNGSYKSEKIINGCGAFAMGWYGLDDHAKTHGACGPKWKFGTKFYIEGWGTITCVDRGGSIDNNDIDIWYGIGQQALNDLKENKHPKSATVKIVYLPS